MVYTIFGNIAEHKFTANGTNSPIVILFSQFISRLLVSRGDYKPIAVKDVTYFISFFGHESLIIYLPTLLGIEAGFVQYNTTVTAASDLINKLFFINDCLYRANYRLKL